MQIIGYINTNTRAVYMGREGVKWARDLVYVIEVGRCGLHGGLYCYQEMSKLIIIFKSMFGVGGLVVSMLASGTRVRGFKPGRSR